MYETGFYLFLYVDTESPVSTLDPSPCTDIEEDVRYRTNSIAILHQVESAEDCRAECQTRTGCVGWVWFSPSAKRGRTNECMVKKDMDENQKETAVGVYSGLRQCEGIYESVGFTLFKLYLSFLLILYHIPKGKPGVT